MEDLPGLIILDTLLSNRKFMNIQEKRNMIIERINIINEHTALVQSNIDIGAQEKEGQPSFQSLIEDFATKKEALLKALDDLQ